MKQDILAYSTVEAKFVEAIGEVDQIFWLKKILVDLHIEPTESIKVYVDDKATIVISKNLLFHGRTNHFIIKFFFLREVE